MSLTPDPGTMGHDASQRNSRQTNDLRRTGSEVGAEWGALEPNGAAIDRDLATVVERWPMLPEAIQRAIVTLAEAASAPGNCTKPPTSNLAGTDQPQ